MTQPPSPLDAGSPVIWSPDGVPRSRLFDDIYYSTADGLAESRAVYLAGCGLPAAWRGRRSFVVGELGFGSGLNILALLDLWRKTREPGARLHIFSIEAFPMPAEDAGRALSAWPELADLAEALTAQWPRQARGFHRIMFEDLDAVLDLAVMDVSEALGEWVGAADAWFLDGFSPALNPAMWSEAVLAAVAARSVRGASAATFTVAGAVRRGLAAAGFTVEKRPGFGGKAERLEARLPGVSPPAAPSPRVAIIGAGIAGAALNRVFRALGVQPVVIDGDPPGAGASGNPAALAMARLDAGGGAVAQLYAQALERAADLFGQGPGAVIAREVVQLESGPKDPGRFDRIAASDLFEPGAMARLSPTEVAARLGEPAEHAGLLIRDALVVEPAAILSHWLADTDVRQAAVERLDWKDGAWSLIDAAGAEIAVADIVCIAAGAGAAALAPTLPLAGVRGQVSFATTHKPPRAVIGDGYLVPTRNGLLFGATHDRDDPSAEVRPRDHLRNLELLRAVRPELVARIDPASLSGRASLRAVTPDFLPLAGLVSGALPGLFILSGLGSRGFCAAPLLAEHVAAEALGLPSPLPRTLAEIVHPERFDRRQKRRLGRSMRAPAADEASPEAPAREERS
jgi:tRNA 5-methylaminomethyl-2-thiouridine biosynthesis bifunctional protein